jgi:hypothetical protein
VLMATNGKRLNLGLAKGMAGFGREFEPKKHPRRTKK